MYDIEKLPQFYIADDGQRITNPVYLLLSDCFLGKPGGPPCYWEQGTELETDLTPNDQMQPLNRAAVERFNQWAASLPLPGVAISSDILLEAASILRQKTGDKEVPHELWRGQVYNLAVEIAQRRAGRQLPAMPQAQTMTPANGREPPPMTAGDFKDVTHRDTSATGAKPHPQIAGRRVRREVPAMATEPRPPAGDAVNMG